MIVYNFDIDSIDLIGIVIISAWKKHVGEDAGEGKRVLHLSTFRSLGVQISADMGREIRFRAARTPSVRSLVRYEARHPLLSTGFSFRCSNKNPRDAAARLSI